MNRLLWRHHPSANLVTFKWLGIAMAMITIWLGAITYAMVNEPAGDPWSLLLGGWLVAAVFTAVGPVTDRAGEFALVLPLHARRLWAVHVGRTLLTSLGLLLVGLGPLTLLVHEVATDAVDPNANAIAAHPQLPALWSHGVAWWLVLLAGVLHDRPHLASIPRDRRWLLQQAALVAIAAAGLLLVGPRTGHAVAITIGAIALGALVLSWRRVPATLDLAPREPVAPARAADPRTLTVPPPWWRRRPFWLVVLMGTAKHPGLHLFAAPFLVVVAIWLTDWVPAYMATPHMGVVFLPITAYMVFTMAASPLFRMHVFDAWPVSRDRLLAILFLPQLTLLVGGYVAGEWLAERAVPDRRPPLTFHANDDRYGLRMAPRYFKLAVGEPPVVTAPDGTRITPPADWRLPFRTDVVLYKPYHTPRGASLEACAWQLARASADVYGRRIPAAVFRDRYLVVNEEGVVAPRHGPELGLARDDATLRPRGFPGLPPLQALAVGLLVLACYAVYLRCHRSGVSAGRRKLAFVGFLAGLLGLHLVPFVLEAVGVLQLDTISTVVFAASDLLVTALPGGAWTAWLMVLVILGAGYLGLQQLFRRAEWTPLREGDALADVLG